MRITLHPVCLAVALMVHGEPSWAGDEKAGSKPAENGKAKGDASKDNKDSKDNKGVEDAGRGLAAFGRLLPLGQENLDVRIPSFRDGVPSSTLRSQTMTRVDDDHMDMVRLDIRIIDNVRQNDLRVQLPTATFDMSASVLSSEQRGRISREDFQLEGDTLIFDTNTGQGKMTGHIHMIIFDTDSMKKKPEPAPVAPTVEDSGAASAKKEQPQVKP